jgi:hypothetical protein
MVISAPHIWEEAATGSARKARHRQFRRHQVFERRADRLEFNGAQGSGLARGNAVTGISPLQESLYNRRCKLSPDRKIGAAESDQTSEPTGAEAQYAAASCDVPPN